ncbi:MAG TPA: hypothetical protein PKA34_16210 [Blastocatellia bacterium]|nr:hypothetical protein [Blastocatellia bacterium]
MLKSSLTALLIACFAALTASTTNAQEDVNAQYITLLSGKLSGEARDIELPVEVTMFRLFVNLRAAGNVKLELLSPSGRPLALNEPNISVSDTDGKRTISIWDPRPGLWKVRLTGGGDFMLSATAQSELYICCAQFFARNLIHQLDKFQPVRGSRHQAQVYASGYNIDVIEFLSISEQGEVIAPLKIRQSDFSNPYNFSLLMETPERPFRLMARGRDMNGKRFQRVFYWLIRPVATEAPAAQPDVPGNIVVAPQPVQDWDNNAVAGEYKIIRSQISDWADEPLLSEKGNPIGLRLKYSIRFPVDGQYSPFPQAFPERITSSYTGALSLRVLRSSVSPLPDGLQPGQQLFAAGRQTFKGGVTYNFTVEMVPSYATYNEQKKSFCLATKAYTQGGQPAGNQQSLRERFEREVMSELKIRYRISFPGTDLEGRTPVLTENSYAPGLWHHSFLKDGVTECP